MISGLYHARARFDRGQSTDYTEDSDRVTRFVGRHPVNDKEPNVLPT